jgi:hypothetical protein
MTFLSDEEVENLFRLSTEEEIKEMIDASTVIKNEKLAMRDVLVGMLGRWPYDRTSKIEVLNATLLKVIELDDALKKANEGKMSLHEMKDFEDFMGIPEKDRLSLKEQIETAEIQKDIDELNKKAWEQNPDF